MAELEIPHAAKMKATRAYAVQETHATVDVLVDVMLKAAAPIIVAVELRRLAPAVVCDADRNLCVMLANELDPEGNTP